MKNKTLIALLMLAGLASSTFADIHTFADFTRPANGASITETFDFVPNEGWSGTPPNTTSGIIYLKVTVSWAATASNIGTFNVRFNQNDDAGATRLGMGKNGGVGTGFEFITSNTTSDPDGAGPATARPTITPVNASTKTSVTLVMKVDHSKAGTNPGGDWWFATEGLQSSAVGFMWIDPNLAASESSQFTPWAAWRSGNASYSGVSFITDTDAVDLQFSNITLYTNGDTPFSTAPPVVDPTTSTVSASPTSIPADGISTSSITVTLKDAGGNPVAGKEVSLAGDGSAVITTANNTSDSGGVVTFSVRSSSQGLETFTATNVTDGDMVITQTASVNFQEVVPVGPVDADQSTVVASASAVPANGIAAATITVTLRDSNGALVVGENVTLQGSPANSTISPADTQATDANGQAAFGVSSSTIGTVVFSAISSTDNTTVTTTAEVEFLDPASIAAYNVNFLDENPLQANVTGQVGVVGSPGEFWNQGYTSVTNLVDSTGEFPSSISVSGLGSDGRTIPNPGLSVFSGVRNITAKGVNATLSITGLEANTAYDVYIYALSHNVTSWGDLTSTERGAGNFITPNTVLGNGQSQWLDNAVAGTNASTFVRNGNYVAFESIVSDGSGNISIVADAYDGIDGNPSIQDGDCRLHVNGLQIRPASGMSVDYAAWRNTYHPGLGLPDEDDDGDGLSNDYERLFGLDPSNPASNNAFITPFDPSTGQFSYSRRTPSLVNMKYSVWVSTDLEEWFEDNGAFQSQQSASNDIEIIDVWIDSALLNEPKLFLQMRAAEITGIDPEPKLLSTRGSGNTITLLFSEPMNPSSAGNFENYSVSQDGGGTRNIIGASVSSDGGSVTLTLDSTLSIATDYTVTLDGVTSGTGQSMQSGLSQQFKTWDDDPNGIQVFILAGQSNMVGRGEAERGNGNVNGAIGSLRYQVVNDNANFGQLVVDSSNPASDPWVVRSDVKFWWNRADIGAGPAISKGGLNPQGFGSGPTTFGPEYGFGWAMGEHLNQPVLIIKTAWGGKSLFGDFRPPGAVADRGGVVGRYYIEMLEQVREILHNLDSEFPAAQHPEFAAVGYRYQIAGFGWHQGYNDSGGANTVAANEYQANMANFITDIRAEFAKPALPFSIGTTGMEGAATSGNRLTVNNAQINVANPALHPELGGNVFTVDTRPFARTTEQSPSNDTTHWNNNGESMWLIGKGMGDGVVDLLSTP